MCNSKKLFSFSYISFQLQAIKKNMKKYTEQFEVMDRLRQSNVSTVSQQISRFLHDKESFKN